MRPAHFFRWGGAFALFAVIVSAFAPRPAAAQQAVPSVKVLPNDVYLYVSIPSVQEMKNRWNKTKFSEIKNDPAFRDFIAELERYYEKFSEEFESKAKMKLDDLLEIPTGEVAFAVMKPPAAQLAAIAFVDFGKSEDVVDQLLEKLEEAMDAQNAERKVQDFQNTRIVVYKFQGADQQEGPIKPQFAYFVKDTQFVISNDISALESALTNWSGNNERSFANNRIFKHIMEKCKTGNAEPVLKWYLNPIEAFRAGVSLAAQGDPQAAMVMGILPVLGLNDFRGMGGTSDVAVDGYEGISKTMLYVDQPPQGLLNLFRFPAADLTPPAWVGEKTQAYMAANWDVLAAYEAVETLVDSFQGAGAFDRIIDDLAEREGGPGIHIKKDIVDQLSGRFYMANHGVESLENAVPKLLFSIGVKNGKTVQDLINKLINMGGAPVKTRNFRDQTIVEIDAGETTAGLCVFNNSILISSNVELVEGVIRGDGAEKPLAQSPHYRLIAGGFPAKTSMLSIQNTADQVKAIYEAARNGEFGPNSEEVPQELKDLFAKLPPFEAIQKYMPISGSYTIPDENGALSISVSKMKE